MATKSAPDKVARQIMSVAIELFAQSGYALVKVPQIAAEAKVSLGTLYQLFPSKLALGNAVFRECLSTWQAFTLDRWPANATPAEEFAAYWEHLCEYAEADLNIALYNERGPGHPLDRQSAALQRRVDRRSDEALRAWIESREIKDLPLEVIKALLHGSFERIIRLPGSRRKRRAMLEAAGELIWQALAAKPDNSIAPRSDS